MIGYTFYFMPPMHTQVYTSKLDNTEHRLISQFIELWQLLFLICTRIVTHVVLHVKNGMLHAPEHCDTLRPHALSKEPLAVARRYEE